nr:G-protein coupled receptor [Ipomoea batatas]GMC66178.1 G-protein coupled receptor [Ipomoea batatas]
MIVFLIHLIYEFAAVLLRALGAASVVVPSTGCYVLDNSSYIYDFVSYVMSIRYKYNLNTDTVVRFCKDVQSRSQKGYVDFGRYDKFNYFVAGSGNVSFVQVSHNASLVTTIVFYFLVILFGLPKLYGK